MIVSYSYYVMDHWVDVEEDDGEYYEEEDNLEELYCCYYPPYYADEKVTIWVDDYRDFEEPEPKYQRWHEPYNNDNF
ncbi:hypothetical protein [Cyanobacterium aponinum]|uniref:Uncharacterized protein n=1 Tax=Cyanobacterium aponinum 0216 TaxID=2676140 RepID=A0A844GR58_9CHRO|nr:hypothetical protein [Cyanobacterium aponinum]MTF37542.1 hypothetical protein [Cyanobacterium aponinum 0216]